MGTVEKEGAGPSDDRRKEWKIPSDSFGGSGLGQQPYC